MEEFLLKLATDLDIPDADYDKAVKRYDNLAEYLSSENSQIAHMEPKIYSQGSIALGTVVKPLNREEEYDIDLVCHCNETLDRITQMNLKKLVGKEIAEYAKANGFSNEPTEGRRNWTLEYAEGSRFHMDILPSINDANRLHEKIFASGYRWDGMDHSSSAIAITDKEHPRYRYITHDWLSSNPLGYRNWFFENMKTVHIALMESAIMAKRSRGEAEDIPEHKVKTPLQRAIQILKRHRDVMFQDDPDDKPISIIITTLAALSYRNQTSLLEAFRSIIYDMENHVNEREGIKWVANPVNPLENFADKWLDNPQKQENFYKWIDTLKEDFNVFLNVKTVSEAGGLLMQRFGSSTVKVIVKELGVSLFPVVQANKALDVAHRRNPSWPIEARHLITLNAEIKTDGFRWERFQSGTQLPKNRKLRFTAHGDVPKGSKYYWQVVNTGSEATARGQLRGDIFEVRLEKGRAMQEEGTSYTGTHWIECFVVKDGVCIGRSGEFMVVIV